MKCLVPLDTDDPSAPVPPPVPSGTFVLEQNLEQGVDLATFDLSSYGFTTPPTNIIPNLVRSDGSKSAIFSTPRQWTATSFTCDLTSPTDDATYVCIIQITP